MKPPIYNGLMKYISRRRTQFTSPGHKGRVKIKGESLCRFDVSGLDETDQILNPKSIVLESEKVVANIFGADKSFYLTGGATCGIYAAIASVCKVGDKIIVDSECDKSVINAITQLALIPIFIKRSYNKKYDICGGINTEELEYLTERHRDAKAVLITSPTYYGVCANIRKASEICHGKNMLLIVDEALGAHFRFYEKFPETALECGADIVIHSLSKTLGGFTGSGLLHLSTPLVSEDEIRQQLAFYQGGSSSFAFICASENAILYAFKNSKKYIPLLKELKRGKEIINHNTDLMWLDADFNIGSDISEVDPTRVVINFSKVDISAGDAATLLINKYGIEPETADKDNLVFSVSLYNTPTEIRKLVNSCISIAKITSSRYSLEDEEYESARRKTVKVLPYKAFNCDGEKIHYENSEGRLCRRILYKYPHGTPVIIPGEKITSDHIDKIRSILKYGGSISGLDDNGNIEVLGLGDSFYV